MIRNLFATLSFGALSALFAATSAYAQHRVEANVPFAFTVGHTHMPAGTYAIKVNLLNAFVTIHNCDDNSAIALPAQQEYPGKKSQKLVFRQVRGQYFLAEIWGEEGSDGMTFRTPKSEKRIEEASAPAHAGNEVLIALK